MKQLSFRLCLAGTLLKLCGAPQLLCGIHHARQAVVMGIPVIGTIMPFLLVLFQE